MRPKRYIISAVIAAAFTAAPAHAAPTVAQSLKIAERVWGPTECSGRERVVRMSELVAWDHGDGHGPAAGQTRVIQRSDGTWKPYDCEIRLAAATHEQHVCRILLHERGHWHHGPGHDGPMSPSALDATAAACDEPALSPRQQLLAGIRKALPRGQWRVTCSPNARSMRCVANKPGARYIREYKAGISGENVWHDDHGKLRLKKTRR